MRRSLVICLAASWLSLTLAGNATNQPSPSVISWPLEHPDLVGGQPTLVLGQPVTRPTPHGLALFFNGTSDGLLVPVNPLAGWSQFTIEVLFHPEEGGLAEQRFVHIEDAAGWRVMIETRLDGKGGWWLDTFLGNGRNIKQPLIDPRRVHPTNRWYWVALTYDGRRMTHFINGGQELAADVAFGPQGPGQISLGVRQNKVYWFKGGIREIRFTPRALPAAELQHPAEN
jgi:hypothetical protein